MQLPCQTGRVDGSITCALVVASTHPHSAKCGSERINAVRFGAVSEVSHELLKFDQLGRSGPPPGIRRSGGSSGADAGHADRARGAVEGTRNEAYAAITGNLTAGHRR